MLDAIEPPDDRLVAGARWQPDQRCLAAGDEYMTLAVRCFAAAGLSDQQITRRMLDLIGASTWKDTPSIDRSDAAIAVARHCAMVELPLHHIIAVLAYCAVEVPCWPYSEDLAAIAIAAVAEFA